MCVCVYVWVCVYVYVCMHVHSYVCIYVCIHVSMCVREHVYLHQCVALVNVFVRSFVPGLQLRTCKDCVLDEPCPSLS